MSDHRKYGNHYIDIIRDRDCGPVLQPIRESIRKHYAAGNRSEWLRMSLLLGEALHGARNA